MELFIGFTLALIVVQLGLLNVQLWLASIRISKAIESKKD